MTENPLENMDIMARVTALGARLERFEIIDAETVLRELGALGLSVYYDSKADLRGPVLMDTARPDVETARRDDPTDSLAELRMMIVKMLDHPQRTRGLDALLADARQIERYILGS